MSKCEPNVLAQYLKYQECIAAAYQRVLQEQPLKAASKLAYQYLLVRVRVRTVVIRVV